MAPLPAGVEGHFGPELKRFVLLQHHQGQVTAERITAFLASLGVAISKRQVVRLLTAKSAALIAEAKAVLRAGLASAHWITVDDTGTRHRAKNGVTTQIGDGRFAFFATSFSKSRRNFLEILRAGHEDYVLNTAAFASMQERGYDPRTDPISYDLEKAKSLLAKSSVPNGFEFSAHVPSGNSARIAIAQIWADSLAQIGIKMNIEQLEETTAQELYNTERFTVRISAWNNDTPDPDELMGVALDYQPQNGLHSSYRSDEARNLVLEARRTLDLEKRQELYSNLQRIVNRDCPFLYAVEEDRLYGSTSAVQGFAPNSQGKYSFENVWLKR